MNKLIGVLVFVFTFIGASGALADPPLGIQGNVMVLNDGANPIPVSHPAMTHMGQTPQDHLNLEGFPSADLACETGHVALQSIFADGTKSGAAFVVPTDKVLVITDISAIVGGNLMPAGRIAEVQLYAGSDLVFRRGVTVGSEAASLQMAAVNVAIRSGVIVGAGETPCVRGGVNFSGGGGGFQDIRNISIQGYLIEK